MTFVLGKQESADVIRFRDDDPELFGIAVGEGPCDESYVQNLRHHLSHAVEAVPSLFPGLSEVLGEVQERLLPNDTCRTFVSNDPAPQAYCMGGKQAHTVIIGITSGLLSLLEREELMFVVGHEIGHHLMGHHNYALATQAMVESVNFRSLQRMGEISADRVGFLACPSSEDAFRAILKTASGIGSPHLRFDYGAFNDQMRRLTKIASGGGDAHATHPLFTVRCRALTLFEMSDAYYDVIGKSARPAISRDDMDDKISSDLAESTGYHPVAEMERAVRISVIWILLRLFVEDGRFSKAEQAFIRDNFDADLANNAIEFVRSHGPFAVRKKYEEALGEVASMPESTRRAACETARRVASVASGTEDDKLPVLREVHERLGCGDPVRVESWNDEQTFSDLLDLS